MAEAPEPAALVPNKDYQTSYTLFSTFREEASTGVGDPFRDVPPLKPAQGNGKRMAIQPGRSGRNPEVLFDHNIRSLAEGDQYLDPIYVAKEIKQKLGGKQVTEKAFFPPKNTKHSACPGDPSACLGEVGLLGADWQDRERAEDKTSVKGKKNLYVNPPRKGGCGYSLAERTIGQKAPKYMPDPYQNGREIGRQLRKESRARIPKPFNSSPNSGTGLFNSNPYSFPPGPAYKDKAPAKAAEGKEEAKKKPFAPPNPPAKGAAYCALSKVGRDYVPEPVEEKPSKREADGETLKPFKPCGGIKERLSMKTVNPYQYDARPPPDLDFTLFD